jgi:radical SAM superfamily enzyme YgiQ (UPF0313 family)
MRVAIYNLEPNLNNYALDKVRTYYQSKHIATEDYFFNDRYDEVWCSAIFSNHVVATIPDTAFRGGTGLDLTITLPPEIDACNPHKNYGFTTRGCIRNCPFCVVPRKRQAFKNGTQPPQINTPAGLKTIAAFENNDGGGGV